MSVDVRAGASPPSRPANVSTCTRLSQILNLFRSTITFAGREGGLAPALPSTSSGLPDPLLRQLLLQSLGDRGVEAVLSAGLCSLGGDVLITLFGKSDDLRSDRFSFGDAFVDYSLALSDRHLLHLF